MKNIKKQIGFIAGLCLCSGILCFPVMADTVYVTASRLNYRSEPSTSGQALGTIPSGTKLERISNDGEWSVVSVNGKKC